MSLEKAILSRLSKKFAHVYLIGSRARGDATLGSDVDVVVVDSVFRGITYNRRVSLVLSEISDILESESVDVDIVALTPEEFKQMRKERTSFLFGIGEFLADALSGL